MPHCTWRGFTSSCASCSSRHSTWRTNGSNLNTTSPVAFLSAVIWKIYQNIYIKIRVLHLVRVNNTLLHTPWPETLANFALLEQILMKTNILEDTPVHVWECICMVNWTTNWVRICWSCNCLFCRTKQYMQRVDYFESIIKMKTPAL